MKEVKKYIPKVYLLNATKCKSKQKSRKKEINGNVLLPKKISQKLTGKCLQ